MARRGLEKGAPMEGTVQLSPMDAAFLYHERPDEPAASAGERMLTAKIGCLPVIDDGGNLAGIVTEEDFLRWATMQMAHGGREVHAA